MKVVILAGGYGTRISEESHLKPKPMVDIGNMPILWHILKSYSHYGFNDFVICCGYKAHVIKEYFAHYYMHQSDITYDFTNQNEKLVHSNMAEPWRVTLVDTGLNTMTGGRVKRVQKYIGNEPFLLTYGDGVCDVDIKKLVEFHKKNKKLLTLTAVQPDARFGVLDIDSKNNVLAFKEKAKADSGWINGGFMVVEPKVFDYLSGDTTIFEREPLENIAKEKQLVAYKHDGFWQCMDTLRDKQYLDKLIENKEAPWVKW